MLSRRRWEGQSLRAIRLSEGSRGSQEENGVHREGAAEREEKDGLATCDSNGERKGGSQEREPAEDVRVEKGEDAGKRMLVSNRADLSLKQAISQEENLAQDGDRGM